LVPVVFRGQVAQSVLLGWFGLMAAVTLTHVILIHQHYRAVPTANQLRRLRTRFLVGVSCAGLAWGSTSIVLLPLDSRVYQLMSSFALGGMITGAAIVLSYVPEAFLAFFLPAIIPITIRFFTQGNEVLVALGVLGLIFSSALFSLAC